MDRKVQKLMPDYRKIYTDIITIRYPDKYTICSGILSKEIISYIDVLELNKILFGDKKKELNQKFKSYDKADIIKILDFQKQEKLNNLQLANHFKLSRNTVSKWKKMFLV